MKGGVKTPATLSAYVLISLLEAGLKGNNLHILTGSRCVLETFNMFKKFPPAVDSYSLSIMLYLFAKLDYVIEYDQALQYLNKKAVNKVMLHSISCNVYSISLSHNISCYIIWVC